LFTAAIYAVAPFCFNVVGNVLHVHTLNTVAARTQHTTQVVAAVLPEAGVGDADGGVGGTGDSVPSAFREQYSLHELYAQVPVLPVAVSMVCDSAAFRLVRAATLVQVCSRHELTVQL